MPSNTLGQSSLGANFALIIINITRPLAKWPFGRSHTFKLSNVEEKPSRLRSCVEEAIDVVIVVLADLG